MPITGLHGHKFTHYIYIIIFFISISVLLELILVTRLTNILPASLLRSSKIQCNNKQLFSCFVESQKRSSKAHFAEFISWNIQFCRLSVKKFIYGFAFKPNFSVCPAAAALLLLFWNIQNFFLLNLLSTKFFFNKELKENHQARQKWGQLEIWPNIES